VKSKFQAANNSFHMHTLRILGKLWQEFQHFLRFVKFTIRLNKNFVQTVKTTVFVWTRAFLIALGVSKSLVLNPSKWVHILRSVITAIHFSYLFVSLVYLRTYRHLSHTVPSCIVSCECEHYVHISEQRCLMLVTYRYWLSVKLCIKDRSD